jgi:adenylate kinase
MSRNCPTGKAVVDVPRNQERLVEAVDALRATPEIILLDGHFCLWDANQSVVPVPVDIFRRIGPFAVVLVETMPHEVVARLRKRDGFQLSQDLVERLLGAENEHARLVADALDVPLFSADQSSRAEDIADQLRLVVEGLD